MRRGRGRTHRRTSGGLGYDAVRPVRMLRLEQAPALLCSGCRRPGVRTGRDQRSVCGRTRGCWPGRDARGGLIGSSRGRCGRSAGAHEQPCQQRGNGHQGRTRTGQHRWDRHENLPGGARPTTPAPRFAGSTPPGDAASGGSPGGGKRRTRRAADGRCCSGWTRTQPENELRTPAPAALLPGQTPTPTGITSLRRRAESVLPGTPDHLGRRLAAGLRWSGGRESSPAADQKSCR